MGFHCVSQEKIQCHSCVGLWEKSTSLCKVGLGPRMQPQTNSSKELPECLIHKLTHTCVEVKSYFREPCGQMKNLSEIKQHSSALPSLLTQPYFHMNLSC